MINKIMVFRAFGKVFKNPFYATVGIFASLAAFTLTVWLSNLKVVTGILFSEGSLPERTALPVALLRSVFTSFSTISALVVISISVLFGVNVAMFAFFLKRNISKVKASGMAPGFAGTISGTLGIGCSACGSLFLVTLLTWVGAGTVVRFLPLKGEELGIAGAVLLFLSIFIAAKNIENPSVCKI